MFLYYDSSTITATVLGWEWDGKEHCLFSEFARCICIPNEDTFAAGTARMGTGVFVLSNHDEKQLSATSEAFARFDV